MRVKSSPQHTHVHTHVHTQARARPSMLSKESARKRSRAAARPVPQTPPTENMDEEEEERPLLPPVPDSYKPSPAPSSTRRDAAGRGSGREAGAGGGAAAIDDDEVEEEAPDIVTRPFDSARLADIRAYNDTHGITSLPSTKNPYLRPHHNWCIELRNPSVLPRVFKTCINMKKNGASAKDKKITLTIVIFRGAPTIAVDVMDAGRTFLFSGRMSTVVHLHPDFEGSEASTFPIITLDAGDLVHSLAPATETHQVLMYQKREHEDCVHVLMQVPSAPGPIHLDTLKLEYDGEVEAIQFMDCVHTLTFQLRVQKLLNLCKRNNYNPKGSLALSVYHETAKATDVTAGTIAPGNMYLVTEIVDEKKQAAQVIIPMTVTTADEEGGLTLRVCEPTLEHGFSVEDVIMDKTRMHMHEFFRCNPVTAFLSEIEPKKTVVMRVASEQVMVMSYKHGENILLQLILPPQEVDEDEA